MEKKIYLLLLTIGSPLIAIGLILGRETLTIVGIAVAITTGILGILTLYSKYRSKKTDFLVNTDAIQRI